MFEWSYIGVNNTVPGNGGPECVAFLSTKRKIMETILALAFASFIFFWGFLNITLPKSYGCEKRDGGKQLLLILSSLVIGIEIGFKFATRSVIYLLNPCHITTFLQIYLLASPPSKEVTSVFRIHLNFINGAVLAFMFPETESRVLPFQWQIYWIQHAMIIIVPYYLLRLGGAYNVEKLCDFSWALLSYGLNLAYHFIVLQAFSIPAQANLNHMLCPAVLDPFYGPNYRMCALIHQAILCPAVCKAFCLICDFFSSKLSGTKTKKCLSCYYRFEYENLDKQSIKEN